MRNLEPLSQNNPQWKDTKLGLSDSVTLGTAGCFVTAFSVLSYYYGHPLSPFDMNTALINANLFANQDLISSDDDLQKLFDDIQYIETIHCENTPANLSLLKDLMSDPTKSVIVEIDLGNGSVHFTPVADCDGTNVTLMNVWNGSVQDLKSVYGDPATKILKFVVYQGTPAIDPAPDTLLEIKNSDFLKLLQKSQELDKIGLGLGFDQQTIDTMGFAEKVLEKVKEARTGTIPPPAPDNAPSENSAPVQPLSSTQTNLLLKFLAMLGLRIGV